MTNRLILVLALALVGCNANPNTKNIVEANVRSIFRVHPTNNNRVWGTAWIVRIPGYNAKGFAITNSHVCKGIEHFSGKVAAGQFYESEDDVDLVRVKQDTKKDLCLLAFTDSKALKNRTPLTLAKQSSHTEFGTAMGFPATGELFVSSGFLLNTREIQVADFADDDAKCEPDETNRTLASGDQICLSTHITRNTSIIVFGGMSGSPVLNSDNEVVGVVMAKSNIEPYAGSIIPVEAVRDFLKGK